ncbi:hypothetical protein ACJX0J_035960, partial [Zea mays]
HFRLALILIGFYCFCFISIPCLLVGTCEHFLKGGSTKYSHCELLGYMIAQHLIHLVFLEFIYNMCLNNSHFEY